MQKCHWARSVIDPNTLQILVTAHAEKNWNWCRKRQSDQRVKGLNSWYSRLKVPRHRNYLPASPKLFCLGSAKHSFSLKNAHPHFSCRTPDSFWFHPICLTGLKHPPGWCNGNHSFGVLYTLFCWFNPTFLSAEFLELSMVQHSSTQPFGAFFTHFFADMFFGSIPRLVNGSSPHVGWLNTPPPCWSRKWTWHKVNMGGSLGWEGDWVEMFFSCVVFSRDDVDDQTPDFQFFE